MTVQELLDFLEENEVPGDALIYIYPADGSASQEATEVAVSFNDYNTTTEEWAYAGFTGDPEDIRAIRIFCS